MSQAGELDVIKNHPEIPTMFPTNMGTAIPMANELEILGTGLVFTTGVGNVVTIELTEDPITEINVDATTGTGTDPVLPTSNAITISGGQYASGTYPDVITTVSTAPSTFDVQAQISAAVAASDSSKNGLAHFDSSMFAVDAAGFVQLAGASNAIDSVLVQAGTSPVLPDIFGQITIMGSTVSAGTIPIQTNGTGPNTVDIEVQISQAIAATDASKIGLANFNSAMFSVDANGFVSLAGGGLAIDSIGVQTGTSPIVPTAAGLVTINGATVAAGTNPVRTDGTGANTMAVEVQISQALAATDATKIGLSNFDSAAFDVDANGFVQLNGGGIAATSFDVQANTAPGTDPVVPSATGAVTVNGAAVAAHSVVIETRSRAANAYNIEVQYASAVAATDATKSGVAHFDSARFSTDANGFVSINGSGVGETITGDSGGALNPSSGNWNIVGLSGSKTSGSGSTLTVKSPPYSDQGGSTTVTLNSGSFATAAITLTTPATAGLADGDLLEFVATNGVLVIQLAATQVAHIGSVATTAAGTLTSTATGDSVSLRYQASTNDWWATSSIGTWVLA